MIIFKSLLNKTIMVLNKKNEQIQITIAIDKLANQPLTNKMQMLQNNNLYF